MDENEENNIDTSSSKGDNQCPRCGLRSYDDTCQNCGASMMDGSDDEEEEYDWREHKR